jgi:hypothetical protein
MISALVLAMSIPIVKVDKCPQGYWERSGYCYPISNTVVIEKPKELSCPTGWWWRGGYCVRN